MLQLLIGNEREAVTSDLYEGMQNGPIYLVLQGGTARIVFSVDLMEGNAVTLLYKVEDYRPVLLDEISGQTAGWKDSDLRIQKYIDVLGSWDAFRAYSFQNDTFQPAEELWEIRIRMMFLSYPIRCLSSSRGRMEPLKVPLWLRGPR